MSFSCNRSRSIRGRDLIVASLSLVLAIGIAPAGFGRPAEKSSQSDPVFNALFLDGRTETGRLVSIGPGSITLASAAGAKHELAIARLFKLTREVSGSVPAIDRSMIVLPEGDRLMRVTLGPATETALEVQSDSLGKLAVPLESVLGWIVVVPTDTDSLDVLWNRVRLEPRKEEVVWLSNGDRLSGGFLGWDERKIKLQVSGKPLELDRTGIVAVGFDPALASYPRPASGFLELALKDGSRLGLSGATIEDGNVQGTSRFGSKARFLLSELVGINVRTQSYVYLTERKMTTDRYFSYVGPTRQFRVDRTISGHFFELSGQTFDHGIGAESRTLLAYELEAGDRRFQAIVGVDQRAGPLGSVVFRVLVDSQERFKSAPLSSRDAPQSIDVDVTGGKYLILDTGFGDRGNVRDLADWVEARLVR